MTVRTRAAEQWGQLSVSGRRADPLIPPVVIFISLERNHVVLYHVGGARNVWLTCGRKYCDVGDSNKKSQSNLGRGCVACVRPPFTPVNLPIPERGSGPHLVFGFSHINTWLTDWSKYDWRRRLGDHAPFRDGLSSLGWDLIRSTCLPNLKSLNSPTMKIRKAPQNVEIGMVLGG